MGDKLKVEFRARDLQLVGSGEDQGPGDKLVNGHGWCMVAVVAVGAGAVVRYGVLWKPTRYLRN